MEKYEILASRVTKRGVKVTVSMGAEKDDLVFADIRAGLAWPTDRSPFYCCVLGQPWVDTRFYNPAHPNYELLAEFEHKSLDLDERLSRMADVAVLYKCDFFGDLSASFEEDAHAYHEFKVGKGFSYGDLRPAPFPERFRLGVELIKSWIKSHRLDPMKGSIVSDQLLKITEADLANPKVKELFFAVESLRHAVASFKRDPPVQPLIGTHRRNYPTSPHSWMV